MKNTKKIIFVVILMVLSTFTIGIAAEAVFMKNQQKNINNSISQPSLFDAEITFTIVIDDGCGCNPIEGVHIQAYGGSGSDEGVTDENGTLILYLEINAEYRVDITSEEYRPIRFDFNIIDDQYFVFQMKERGTSSYSIPLFETLINNVLLK